MQFAGKILFAGAVSLALAAPVPAQVPYGGFRTPVFQANPNAAMNQMAIGQAVAAQFGFGGGLGGAPAAGGPVIVPGLGPAATLSRVARSGRRRWIR